MPTSTTDEGTETLQLTGLTNDDKVAIKQQALLEGISASELMLKAYAFYISRKR